MTSIEQEPETGVVDIPSSPETPEEPPKGVMITVKFISPPGEDVSVPELKVMACVKPG